MTHYLIERAIFFAVMFAAISLRASVGAPLWHIGLLALFTVALCSLVSYAITHKRYLMAGSSLWAGLLIVMLTGT